MDEVVVNDVCKLPEVELLFGPVVELDVEDVNFPMLKPPEIVEVVVVPPRSIFGVVEEFVAEVELDPPPKPKPEVVDTAGVVEEPPILKPVPVPLLGAVVELVEVVDRPPKGVVVEAAGLVVEAPKLKPPELVEVDVAPPSSVFGVVDEIPLPKPAEFSPPKPEEVEAAGVVEEPPILKPVPVPLLGAVVELVEVVDRPPKGVVVEAAGLVVEAPKLKPPELVEVDVAPPSSVFGVVDEIPLPKPAEFSPPKLEEPPILKPVPVALLVVVVEFNVDPKPKLGPELPLEPVFEIPPELKFVVVFDCFPKLKFDPVAPVVDPDPAEPNPIEEFVCGWEFEPNPPKPNPLLALELLVCPKLNPVDGAEVEELVAPVELPKEKLVVAVDGLFAVFNEPNKEVDVAPVLGLEPKILGVTPGFLLSEPKLKPDEVVLVVFVPVWFELKLNDILIIYFIRNLN